MLPMQQNELLSSTVLFPRAEQREGEAHSNGGATGNSNSSPDRGLGEERTTTVAKARRKEDDVLEVVLQEMALDLL